MKQTVFCFAILFCDDFAKQKPLQNSNGSLKPKIERRLAANTSNITLLICQDVGEPPTLHQLQVLQRFQTAKSQVLKNLAFLAPQAGLEPATCGLYSRFN